MAAVNGVVEVAMNPNKFGKFSILVNDNWYNTKPEWLDNKPEKGDVVSFDDGGKKYIKGLKITGKGEGGGTSTYSAPKSKGYSNLGVELGHAANLGIQVAMAMCDKEEVGTPEFYKTFAEQTKHMKAVMDKLRESYEAKPAPVKEEKGEEEVLVLSPKKTTEEDMEDIF